MIGGHLLLHRVVLDELLDDRHDVQAGGEVPGDDEPQGIALLEVVALVKEHGPQLGVIEPLDETGREADPRPAEPIAERERPHVADDVDPAVESRGGGDSTDAVRHRDPARQQRADERQRREELLEQRGEPEAHTRGG